VAHWPRTPAAPGDDSSRMVVLRSAGGGKVALEHPLRTKKQAEAMLEAKEDRGELVACDRATRRRSAVVAPGRGVTAWRRGAG
jgi:hypothetical protein